MDVEDQSTFISVEFERRLGDDWKLEIENRIFVKVDNENSAAAFKNDTFINFKLTRFF